jgi:AraC-like DNA-binding protein
MISALPPDTRATRSSIVARLSRARDRLRDVGSERLTIAAIAREAALSPYQFIRTFKAVFGETPHQVRIDARLDLARQMLILGSAPVTEICAAVGFTSLGTFSHLFARRVGASPSQFRRSARAQAQAPGTLPAKLYPGCISLMGGRR